jgi:hypothetical protein
MYLEATVLTYLFATNTTRTESLPEFWFDLSCENHQSRIIDGTVSFKASYYWLLVGRLVDLVQSQVY